MGGTVAVIAEAECGLNAGGLILIEPIFLMEELYSETYSCYRTIPWPQKP